MIIKTESLFKHIPVSAFFFLAISTFMMLPYFSAEARPAPRTKARKSEIRGPGENIIKLPEGYRIVEGAISSFSPDTKEIKIGDSSYQVCKDADIFTQTSSHLRRASLINLEAAEEAKLYIDSRELCARFIIITRTGR